MCENKTHTHKKKNITDYQGMEREKRTKNQNGPRCLKSTSNIAIALILIVSCIDVKS